MRALIFLILLTSCVSKSVSIHDKCANLKNEVRLKWVEGKPTIAAASSIEFLTEIKENYAECLVGRDTSFIISIFGRQFIPTAGICTKKQASKLAFTLEYQVSTRNTALPNCVLNFSVDSSNTVQCIDVLRFGSQN